MAISGAEGKIHPSRRPAGAAGDIAIVGMALHVPGASDLETFWRNLTAGHCAIRRLSEAELLAAGEDPALLARPEYVPYAAPLEGYADFDPAFFGFSAREAEILDPQHRQFLEVAWEALENAALPPERLTGPVGVFAGCGMAAYFAFNLCSRRDLVEKTGLFLLRHTGNDKDFLATRVSHVLDLKGPSIGVQTACSTSLVAVHQAVQALREGACTAALAGGVTVELPQNRGYLWREGEVLSPDGMCHAFDHRAAGTVFGSGAACVVLRRLEDALGEGDHVWAVIKGSAVNNDGAAKAGYLAPSVGGQADCVAAALADAGVPADSIGYVEAHGTGTALGDVIEIAALSEAFRRSTPARGFCRIGSVKTGIGHLDTAAGVVGLIKTALSLHHRQLPPTLGYEAPNPKIDFAASPFVVNDRLTAWEGAPRRAGVNSLGVGGTNAHVILEEAPPRGAGAETGWPFHPILLSARDDAALKAQSARLAAHLRAHPELPLADVAHTLLHGRRHFPRRRICVAHDPGEAAELLETAPPDRVFEHEALERPEVIFLFPGGGAHYPAMARDLHETEPVFAEAMDNGLAVLEELWRADPHALWRQGDAAALERSSRQLPLILLTEVALARLFASWGVEPSAMLGHSLGEYAAAVVAGVFRLEDALRLTHLRGTLFERVGGRHDGRGPCRGHAA